MQMREKKKCLSSILCMMLIVAMAFGTTGCNKEDKKASNDVTADAGQTAEVKEVGEGKVSFDFSVVDKAGNETRFLVHTDKETVGEALLSLGLITGEDGAYGMYVKKVNGIVADYDVDQTYWAFYINGEYAMSGVDKTTIKEGESYSFKVEK